MIITPIDLATAVSIIGSILVALKAFFVLQERMRVNRGDIDKILERLEVFDLGRTKFCVETLWVFQLRRGMVEAIDNDLGSEKSPFQLTEAACQLLDPLMPEMKKFYQDAGGNKLGLVELSVALENRFGEKIVEEVCKKVKVTKAACMVIAITMLRSLSQHTLTMALRDAEANYHTLKRLEPSGSGTSQGHGSDEVLLQILRP